ncbi:MAG TPA: DUF6268 family outer membrane beta-barrel protein [Niastella sp.]
MNLCKTNKQLFFSAFLIITSLSVNAQIVFKTEYFGQSNYRVSEGERNERVGNSKGSAMVYQGGVNIPLSVKFNDNNRPTRWSLNVGGAYVKLNNKDFTDPLVIDEILNFGVSLNHLRPLNDKWSMMAVIGGGIYMPGTNLSQMGIENILGSAGIIFIRHLRPNLDLGGGLAITNSFGMPMLFPAVYLNWKTQGKYIVKVSMIRGLEVAAGYDVNKNLSLQFIAEMNGQSALLEQDGKKKIFSHAYLVTGFRPEIKLGNKLSIPVTVGINAWRPTQMTDRKLKSMFQKNKEYYFQASFYASLGLKISF